MNAIWSRCTLAVALSSTLLTGAAPRVLAQAQQGPRYAAAIEEELANLGLDARCAAESSSRHRCSFAARSTLTERALSAHIVYDDRTDTVYCYLESLVTLPSEPRARARLLQRMMELNWELLAAKFEWNPRDGEVRLSAVLHTDSNFDRRAFRSILTTLDKLGARYRPELLSLAR